MRRIGIVLVVVTLIVVSVALAGDGGAYEQERREIRTDLRWMDVMATSGVGGVSNEVEWNRAIDRMIPILESMRIN